MPSVHHQRGKSRRRRSEHDQPEKTKAEQDESQGQAPVRRSSSKTKTGDTSPRRRSRTRRRHRHISHEQRKLLSNLAWVLFVLIFASGISWLLLRSGHTPQLQGRDTYLSQIAVPTVIAAKVKLPQDDAPHHNMMEWWYYNGHLNSTEGKAYSFHYTVFLVGGLFTYTIMHASLTDLQSGEHYSAEIETPGNPSGTQKDGFNFQLKSWLLRGSDGKDHLKMQSGEFALDIKADTEQAPVLHGDRGFKSLGTAGSTFYYSRPQMQLSGNLRLGEQNTAVEGTAWFDHQWGDFNPKQLGWEWFALQLSDGTDIMLYHFYNDQNRPWPELDFGTYTKDNRLIRLNGEDFMSRSLASWHSEKTGITYPQNWQVELPEQGIKLNITPVIRSSEIDSRKSVGFAYWEGAVKISGTHNGKGFVEVAGVNVGQATQNPGKTGQ